MAVTMKNAIFKDVTPFRSCKNRHFGGTLFLFILMMDEAIHSSETSVLTGATCHHIPEGGTFQALVVFSLKGKGERELILPFSDFPAIFKSRARKSESYRF
jgi:hypothetical protein